MDRTSRETGRDEMAARLELQATELLKALGAFRRGTGIRSPRSEREAARGQVPFSDWLDDRDDPMDLLVIAQEMDLIAKEARLTPAERQVVQLVRVMGCTIREAAERMNLKRDLAHRRAQSASKKMERVTRDLTPEDRPLSAAALFNLEIRQKRGCIYRAPSRCRPRRRTSPKPKE